MEKKTISIPYEILSYEELQDADALLVDTAREASFRSYAPYSRFSVGAAILLDNGEIVPGSNQENVAFPSGTCAERSACFYAHARYPDAKFLFTFIFYITSNFIFMCGQNNLRLGKLILNYFYKGCHVQFIQRLTRIIYHKDIKISCHYFL